MSDMPIRKFKFVDQRWTHRKRHVDIVSRSFCTPPFSSKASYPVLLTTDWTASLANGSLIVLHEFLSPFSLCWEWWFREFAAKHELSWGWQNSMHLTDRDAIGEMSRCHYRYISNFFAVCLLSAALLHNVLCHYVVWFHYITVVWWCKQMEHGRNHGMQS